MIDIRLFREDPDRIKKSEKKRGKDPRTVDEVLKYDRMWREALQRTEKLKHERNVVSREIAELKKSGKQAKEKILEMKKVNDGIAINDLKIKELLGKRDAAMYRIGNILHNDVPKGVSDEDNKVIRTWGSAKVWKDFAQDFRKQASGMKHEAMAFRPKSHVDILKDLDLGDTEKASAISGARFFYLKNELVLMGLALQRFAMDLLASRGFRPMYTPFMLLKKPMEGAAELSDFESSLYKIEDEDLFLIATAEQTLAAYHMDEVLDKKELPKTYAGFSTNFRREAGSHGKDTKGIFRVHQFEKIEQFVLTTPEDSWKWFDKLIRNAEDICRKLELPYRVVSICSGQMNDNAAKKYDIEIWFPSQGAFREVVSCSNCTDYQPRKLNIRYLDNGERKHVHALNATALAVERILVAIMENFQTKEGKVRVPKALRPYLDFREIG